MQRDFFCSYSSTVMVDRAHIRTPKNTSEITHPETTVTAAIMDYGGA
jgi:hypothetical protein